MPISIKHNKEKAICAKESKSILENLEKEPKPLEEGNILFTYDVVYEYSDITLASRWVHFKTVRAGIHWTGIILSEVWVIVISISICLFLCRNLKNGTTSYKYRVSNLEEINEYDRKQIAGDIYRPPSLNVILLSSFHGTGTQLLLMVEATLALGVFGFMNPEQRANILNIGILFFCFMGLPGGYIAALF